MRKLLIMTLIMGLMANVSDAQSLLRSSIGSIGSSHSGDFYLVQNIGSSQVMSRSNNLKLLNPFVFGLNASVIDVASNLMVYPNPTTSILQIKSDIEIGKVVVLDNIGRVCPTLVEVGSGIVNVSSLTPGIYSLSIEVGNNIEIVKFEKL